MDYSQLTDEELAALPPELLQEVLAEIESGNSSEPTVVESTHPEMSNYDRWVVKNLASNPEAGIGYLQKNYPNMEFMQTDDGEIIMKNAGDSQFYRLDEEGFSLADIGDVVADVGQGVVEGVGGAAAGLSTLNPLVGVGTSMAIGGASEAAKQSLGSALGIPDNRDTGNVVTSGVVSGIMPGVGRGVKSAWNIARKAGPKVASFFSAIPEDVIKNINADDIARSDISRMGITNYADNVARGVQTGMNEAREQSGKAVGQAIGDNPIDMAPVKNDIADYLGVDQFKNPDMALYMTGQRPRAVTSSFSDNQRKTAGYLFDDLDSYGNNISPLDAIRAKNHFYGISQGDKSELGQNALSAMTNDISGTERMVANRASEGIREQLKAAAPDEQIFNDAMKKHSDVMTTYTDPRMKAFNKTDKTQKFLSHFNRPKKKGDIQYRDEFLDRIAETTKNTSSPANLPEQARQYKSWEVFDDPSILSPDSKLRSGAWGGMIGTGLGWMSTGNALGGAAGGLIGSTGGNVLASPWMIKHAAQVAPYLEDAGSGTARYIYENPYFRTDKALYNMTRD